MAEIVRNRGGIRGAALIFNSKRLKSVLKTNRKVKDWKR